MKKLNKIGLMFLFLVLSFTSFSATTIKINFKSPTWLTTPCIYTWHGGGSASAERFTGTSPGSAMTVDSVHTGWFTTTIDIGSYTDDIKVIINNKNASGEVTSQTADIQIPNSIIVKDSAAEVWYDGTTWSSSTNKPSFSAITISPWVLKNVVVHYRNTSEFTSVNTLISSGTTKIYSNMMLPDANNPGWYSYTISTYENYPYNISFNNGYGITTSIYPIENGKTEVWFDSKRSYTGWLEKRDLLIHFRKPADWQTAYLYPFPDKKLRDYPGWGMTAETGHDEWFSFNLSDVEIPANIKFSDRGEDSKSVEIAIENINNNNEVWYDGLMNKFLNGYPSGTTYTKFTVKVDMSVLWGSDLPDAVYMYMINSDGTTTNVDGKNYYKTITGLSVQGKFCSDYRPNGNISEIKKDEQNTSGALKLTDPDYDGVYTGTVYYDGITCPTKIATILYIRKDDPKNVMHRPTYELKKGSDSSSSLVTIQSDYRNISINNGKINVGNDTNSQINNEWNLAWEDKSVNSFVISSDISIYEGLSVNLNVEAKYNNANDTLKRNITKYVTAATADTSISKVAKEITDNKVSSVRITGEKVGKTTLTVERNGKNCTVNINVVPINSATSYQTAIYKNNDGFPVGQVYEITGAGNYGDEKIVKGIGLNSIDLITRFTSSSDYLEKAFIKDSNNLNFWQSDAAKSIMMIPLERKKTTELGKLSINGNSMVKDMVLPITIDEMSIKNSSTRVTINWNEPIDRYKNIFTKQKIVVRISKITSTSNELRYDIYNKKNPFVYGYAVSENSNAAAVQDFDAASSGKYLDFDFDSGISQTRIGYDGRSVQYITSSTQKNLYIQNFKEGKYKVQIYTIREASDYAIVTFEKELPFEILKEDSSLIEDDNGSYIIQQIITKDFGSIKSYFISKTSEALNLTKDNIVYDKKTAKVGERKEYVDPTTKEGSFDGVVGKITPDDTVIQKDTEFSATKPPLDIVLCIDNSLSMGTYMSTIKSAWQNFENDVKNRGYDVKFKYVIYGGENYNNNYLVSSSWNSSLIDSDCFNSNSNDPSWSTEQTYQAMYKAVDVLTNTGRYFAADNNGKWGYNTSKNGIPSTKMMIYITDSNAAKVSVDDLEYKIRTNSILVSGVANIKLDGLMFEDDYVDENGNRTEAQFPIKNNDE